jgi:thiamine-monophosphate kinase
LILNSGCHALNDVSDGLASECWEIAEASGQGLLLYEDQLPVRQDLQDYVAEMGCSALDLILYGGEDYQLVGTILPDKVEELKSAFSAHNLPFYVIGEVRDDFPGVQLAERQGTLRALEKRGYNHFA